MLTVRLEDSAFLHHLGARGGASLVDAWLLIGHLVVRAVVIAIGIGWPM